MLPSEDLATIASALEPVALPLKFPIDTPGTHIPFCYFPTESAVASVVTSGARGERLEVGLIGHEGVSGIAAILGNTPSPTESFIQVPGHGLRIKTEILCAAVQKSAALSNILLRYVHVFLVQAQQTALVNGRATLEVRLARWLLMAHDRATSPNFAMTHQFLSLMLGVRRAGVTTSLHELEGRGLIKSLRLRVIILDRAGLEAFAGWTYGVPEAQYRRTFAAYERKRAPEQPGLSAPAP